jgi:plasmid maintenance system antidote protein VapI
MGVFSHKDYREYLAEELGEGKRNGQHQRLAEALNCQAAHLSQVLNGKNHLSIEHVFGVNRFFGHNEKESEYFLNIVQASRSGTKEAQEFFRKKAEAIREKSVKIEDRLTTAKRELSPEEQSVYYGDGLYARVHVASSLPSIKTAADIANVLEVDPAMVNKVVQFLVASGLVTRKDGELSAGPGHTYLGPDSPHMKKHHLNLRLNAIYNIDKGFRSEDVHYATYYTMSKADAFKLKEKILELIDQNVKIVGPSKEEVMYCNIIDFFSIT